MSNTTGELAIVLVSGGMDSCVTAAVAANDGYRLAMLHVNYGQRTEARELVSFHQLAGFYSATERLVADIRELVTSRPYYKVADDVAQRLRIEEGE